MKDYVLHVLFVVSWAYVQRRIVVLEGAFELVVDADSVDTWMVVKGNGINGGMTGHL